MRVIPLSELGLMTVAEAAEYHEVTVEAVRRWVREGLLPVVVVSEGTSTPRHLLRVGDVKAFVKPKRGRPVLPAPQPRKRRKP